MTTEIRVPNHVAIIMDGNGRWAQKRGYPRFYGHIRGANRVRDIVKTSKTAGVKALTLYAFSTENWSRPEDELEVLWRLLKKFIQREQAELKKNGVRLHVIGDWQRLPDAARAALQNAIDYLKDQNEMVLTFALSYGARAELLQVMKAVAQDCVAGKVKPDQIDEAMVQQHLSTQTLGPYSDVDLMIRTSGEKRISNYLLWQCSYAEFDFPETLWPDYTKEEYLKSLAAFSMRDRRYGGVKK